MKNIVRWSVVLVGLLVGVVQGSSESRLRNNSVEDNSQNFRTVNFSPVNNVPASPNAVTTALSPERMSNYSSCSEPITPTLEEILTVVGNGRTNDHKKMVCRLMKSKQLSQEIAQEYNAALRKKYMHELQVNHATHVVRTRDVLTCSSLYVKKPDYLKRYNYPHHGRVQEITLTKSELQEEYDLLFKASADLSELGNLMKQIKAYGDDN